MFHPRELADLRRIAESTFKLSLKHVKITYESDGMGGSNAKETDGDIFACRMHPMTTVEMLANGNTIVSTTKRHKVFTVHTFKASQKDRVVIDGITYEIESVQPGDIETVLVVMRVD